MEFIFVAVDQRNTFINWMKSKPSGKIDSQRLYMSMKDGNQLSKIAE